MGYVPLVAKTGEIIDTKFPTNLIKDVYVKVLSDGGGIYKNQYQRTNGKAGLSEYSLTGVFFLSDLSDTEKATLEEKKKQEAVKYGNDLINQYDQIAGYNIKPPALANYKDLVEWYRKSILAVVGKLSDIAVELGQDQDKTGKAVLQAGQTLVTVSTTIGTLATAGSALAGIASVATPISAGVLAIVGLLDVLGVFRGDDEKNKQIAKDYQQLSAVLQVWYQDYAVAYAKMNAVDQLEFQKELESKYGTSKNNGTLTPPKTGTQSGILDIVTTNYQYIILALFLLGLWWYFKK